jgi:hypothetical protein
MHMEVLPSSAPRYSFMRKPRSGNIRQMFSGYSTWNVVPCEGGDDTAAAIVMNSQEKLRDYSSKRLGKDQTAALPNNIAAAVAASALSEGGGTGASAAIDEDLLRDCELLLAAVDAHTTSTPTSISATSTFPSIPPGVSYSTSVGSLLAAGGTGSGVHSFRMELLPPPPTHVPAPAAPVDIASLIASLDGPMAGIEPAKESAPPPSPDVFTGKEGVEEGVSVGRGRRQHRQQQTLADLLQDEEDEEDDENEPMDADGNADDYDTSREEIGDVMSSQHAVSTTTAAATTTIGVSSGVGRAEEQALLLKIASLHTDNTDDSLVDSLMEVKSSVQVATTFSSSSSTRGLRAEDGLGGDSSHLQWASTVPLSDAEFEALR